MTRTTAFAIILGTVGAPALAQDARGNTVPAASMKDGPASFQDTYQHEAATLIWQTRKCVYVAGQLPSHCENAKASGAPGKPARAPGAR